MKTATLLLLLAFILSACATAVTSTPAAVPTQTTEPTPDMKALGAEIDALLTKNYQEGVFDCSVLVAQYGQLILSQGYGFADRYQKIPITPKTKFPIGSLTKQFTALAALMLQAQGKLNMQDRLCDYLADCPEVFKPITLHHLITHTSGAPNTTKWDKPGDMMLSKYETLLYEPG